MLINISEYRKNGKIVSALFMKASGQVCKVYIVDKKDSCVIDITQTEAKRLIDGLQKFMDGE